MGITRRTMLATSGAALAGAALGCGGTSSAAGATDAANPADAFDPGFAVGGTGAVDPDHYPDPFDQPPAACELICEQTLGPCRADIDLVRRDISEGVLGLPTRFSMRLVRAGTCAAVAGAAVEVWYTDRNGVYSGPTTRDGTAGGTSSTGFCNGDDAAAIAARFCRGIQMTDADGRVDFDGVFPGWYPGRATHVHVQVREAGQVLATTQLYFDDPLCEQVYTLHPEYSHRPASERTTLDTDSIISRAGDRAPYLYRTRITGAGAVLAWADVAIRATAADPSCSV